MKKESKVFIVDDSAVVRQKVSEFLKKSHKNITVVGGAPNGRVALAKLALPKYKSDVVLVDAIMPEMDGFETIGHIMDRFPTPVIMISGLTEKEVNRSLTNLGMSAFESGAVEYVKKPDPTVLNDVKRFQRELIYKITHLSHLNLTRAYTSFDFQSFLKEEEIEELPLIEKPERIIKEFKDQLIVIGASTGGPRAISLILSKIPSSFPPIIVIQHMPEGMVEPWVKRLQTLHSHLNIEIPTNGEKLRENKVYIAPGGKHCGLKSGKSFHLFGDERVNYVIPAIDVTFIDAAAVYGKNVLGIVLTGMGKDGFEGAKKIKAAGGKIFAEHESTSIIYAMPKAIAEGKLADEIVPLHNIPNSIRRYGWI